MKYMYGSCIFHVRTSGRRPAGKSRGSIKALMDRKKKRCVDGKKEYRSALQTLVPHTL